MGPRGVLSPLKWSEVLVCTSQSFSYLIILVNEMDDANGGFRALWTRRSVISSSWLQSMRRRKSGNPGSGWKSWPRMKEKTSAEKRKGIRLCHEGGSWIMAAGERKVKKTFVEVASDMRRLCWEEADII